MSGSRQPVGEVLRRWQDDAVREPTIDLMAAADDFAAVDARAESLAAIMLHNAAFDND